MLPELRLNYSYSRYDFETFLKKKIFEAFGPFLTLEISILRHLGAKGTACCAFSGAVGG